MITSGKKTAGRALIAALVLGGGILLAVRLFPGGGGAARPAAEKLPVPVETAPVQRGPLVRERTFSGTIEANARGTVASKVAGRIRRLPVDVGDPVDRGQVVAELDDAEFVQAVAEARARRAVTAANLGAAKSRHEIAARELERAQTLHRRGIASESARDTAQAEYLSSRAAVEVAAANLERETAALTTAEIRAGYTRVRAEWATGGNRRTMAERFTDEGNTVAANTPLFTVVELDPVIAAIQVTEKDYPRLAVGQPARLTTEAFPNHVFSGTVSRVAPIFHEATRQARVEITVPNPGRKLKPGMFCRCILELARVDDAVSVPETAITRRHDRDGVFFITTDGTAVRWQPVETGLRSGERVQLLGDPVAGDPVTGQVVTLGQQLLKDGAAVRILSPSPAPPAPTPPATKGDPR